MHTVTTMIAPLLLASIALACGISSPKITQLGRTGMTAEPAELESLERRQSEGDKNSAAKIAKQDVEELIEESAAADCTADQGMPTVAFIGRDKIKWKR